MKQIKIIKNFCIMIQEEYKIKAQEISNLLVTSFIKSSQIFIVNKLYSKNYTCILSIITEWTQTDEGERITSCGKFNHGNQMSNHDNKRWRNQLSRQGNIRFLHQTKNNSDATLTKGSKVSVSTHFCLLFGGLYYNKPLKQK